VTKPAGNLTDEKEEGDADMRRSFMAHFAPKRKNLAVWQKFNVHLARLIRHV
jgi:hypothetical protein